jgi:ABC-2 type transport system permease protein
VKQQELGGLLSDWVETNAHRPSRPKNIFSTIQNLLGKTLVITELEVRKLRHDPTDLFVRAVQPTLWLLIFGQVFTRTHAIPTGNLPYLDFMAPGILAQSALFVAIFSGGMALIWERDLGIVHKFLASPIPRISIVLGKGLASGIRCLSQVFFIYAISLLLGVQLNFNPVAFLQVVLTILLGAGCFCIFSLTIGCLLKSREKFMGIGQLITMPLFFASNAIYPIAMMPKWLQFFSLINPLTYEVDALRGSMLLHGSSVYGFGVDTAILLLTLIILTLICGRLYPQVVI